MTDPAAEARDLLGALGVDRAALATNTINYGSTLPLAQGVRFDV